MARHHRKQDESLVFLDYPTGEGNRPPVLASEPLSKGKRGAGLFKDEVLDAGPEFGLRSVHRAERNGLRLENKREGGFSQRPLRTVRLLVWKQARFYQL